MVATNTRRQQTEVFKQIDTFGTSQVFSWSGQEPSGSPSPGGIVEPKDLRRQSSRECWLQGKPVPKRQNVWFTIGFPYHPLKRSPPKKTETLQRERTETRKDTQTKGRPTRVCISEKHGCIFSCTISPFLVSTDLSFGETGMFEFQPINLLVLK